MRDAFRKGDAAKFDEGRVMRTVDFFQIAARERGLEHKILKNLVHTAYWREENAKKYAEQSFLVNLKEGSQTFLA
jgi:hypothetical protein